MTRIRKLVSGAVVMSILVAPVGLALGPLAADALPGLRHIPLPGVDWWTVERLLSCTHLGGVQGCPL